MPTLLTKSPLLNTTYVFGDEYNCFFGTELGETVHTGGGWDQIFAGGGNDKLFGGVDPNELCGEAGDDFIDGGGANDVIDGGTGFDQMFGGSQNDTFRFHSIADSPSTNFWRMDLIGDFNHSEGDMIDLSPIINDRLHSTQHFQFVGGVSQDGFTPDKLHPFQVGFESNTPGGTLTIWVNTDGDSHADMGIRLQDTGGNLDSHSIAMSMDQWIKDGLVL